jgi:S1-C subfamily serine protease
VNAAVGLLGRVLPATVHVEAEIPGSHPSARLLGTERMGTGTIIDESGLVLTVHYVVVGAARVRVTLLDERELDAEVVKYDFASGLGLLRIPPGNLPHLPLRSTADLALGEEVFAIASVGKQQARVGSGAVSYLGPFDANWEYVLDRAVMTTSVNPGLGGGPLLDRLGRVVAVSSLNMNEVGRFCLCVPAECFLDARDRFLDGGPRGMGTHAWLGLFCYSMNGHVVVAGVLPGSPAERAGLRAGDVVFSIDDRDLSDRGALYRRLRQHRPGDAVVLKLVRDEEPVVVRVASGDVVSYFA